MAVRAWRITEVTGGRVAVWQSEHEELLRLLEDEWQSEHEELLTLLEDEWQSEHEELLRLLEDERPCGSQNMENY